MKFEEYVLHHGKPMELARQEYLFRQGEPNDDLYFVRQGLLKAHYLTLEGKEFIKSFFKEGDLAGSLSATYEGELASFSAVALEDCQILRLEFSPLMEKANDELALARDMMEFLLQLALKKERRDQNPKGVFPKGTTKGDKAGTR